MRRTMPTAEDEGTTGFGMHGFEIRSFFYQAGISSESYFGASDGALAEKEALIVTPARSFNGAV
jgi:hypothetical protein